MKSKNEINLLLHSLEMQWRGSGGAIKIGDSRAKLSGLLSQLCHLLVLPFTFLVLFPHLNNGDNNDIDLIGLLC